MKLKIGDKFSNVTNNRVYKDIVTKGTMFVVIGINNDTQDENHQKTIGYVCNIIRGKKVNSGSYTLYQNELQGIKGPEVKSNKPAWF